LTFIKYGRRWNYFRELLLWFITLEFPLLGINAGRLGFLATITKRKTLPLFSTNCIEWKQYTLRDIVKFGVLSTNEALQDINFAMNEITVVERYYIDDYHRYYLNREFLNSYWADGLIISTPTGSTGFFKLRRPILTCKSLVIPPIAPHSNAETTCYSDDTDIELRVSGKGRDILYL
jgi:NAD+ kinase